MSNVHIIDHSLVKHSLSLLRDKSTKTEMFRRHTATVSQIIIVDVLKNIATKEITVNTPLGKADGHKVQEKIVVVPVLRAGLSMLFPTTPTSAKVWLSPRVEKMKARLEKALLAVQ